MRYDAVALAVEPDEPVDSGVTRRPRHIGAHGRHGPGRVRLGRLARLGERLVGPGDLGAHLLDLRPRLGELAPARLVLVARDDAVGVEPLQLLLLLRQLLEVRLVRGGKLDEARAVILGRLDEVLPELLQVTRRLGLRWRGCCGRLYGLRPALRARGDEGGEDKEGGEEDAGNEIFHQFTGSNKKALGAPKIAVGKLYEAQSDLFQCALRKNSPWGSNLLQIQMFPAPLRLPAPAGAARVRFSPVLL
jgi:hypothetical protein